MLKTKNPIFKLLPLTLKNLENEILARSGATRKKLIMPVVSIAEILKDKAAFGTEYNGMIARAVGSFRQNSYRVCPRTTKGSIRQKRR